MLLCTSRAVGLAATLILLATNATAQDREADAERLFREGQKLLEARRFGEACPKFEAAYAKDRQLGTLLNLAFCHKEQGSIWYAWLEFREAELKAAETKRNERRDFARERLKELERSLPKAMVDNPRRVPLTDVLVEDRRVPGAEHGGAFAAEEGKRKFTFRAKGKKSATMLVTIGKRIDKPQRVAVPDMEDGEDEPSPPVAQQPPPRVEPPPARVVHVTQAGGAQRTIGFVALGVAGAALVVGGVTGVMTFTAPCADNFLHAKDRAECAKDGRGSADTAELISTISIAVAGGAAIGGAVLLVTAPKARSDRGVSVGPVVGPGFAGVRGAF